MTGMVFRVATSVQGLVNSLLCIIQSNSSGRHLNYIRGSCKPYLAKGGVTFETYINATLYLLIQGIFGVINYNG